MYFTLISLSTQWGAKAHNLFHCLLSRRPTPSSEWGPEAHTFFWVGAGGPHLLLSVGLRPTPCVHLYWVKSGMPTLSPRWFLQHLHQEWRWLHRVKCGPLHPQAFFRGTIMQLHWPQCQNFLKLFCEWTSNGPLQHPFVEILRFCCSNLVLEAAREVKKSWRYASAGVGRRSTGAGCGCMPSLHTAGPPRGDSAPRYVIEPPCFGCACAPPPLHTSQSLLSPAADAYAPQEDDEAQSGHRLVVGQPVVSDVAHYCCRTGQAPCHQLPYFLSDFARTPALDLHKPHTSGILSHWIVSWDPPRLIPLSTNTQGSLMPWVPTLKGIRVKERGKGQPIRFGS